MNNSEMTFGYIKNFFDDYGLAIPVNLGIATYPHVLITGASGSGKSKALLFLIGKILQSHSKIVLYICDFKNSDDFSFFQGYPYYFAGKQCYKGIMDYYTKFTEVREKGETGKRYILICDEYPAFINYLQMKDKTEKTKYANDILGAVAEILMLGRGIQFGVWIVTQRSDSILFSNGSRDNFMIIIGLGRLSKEQKSMIFAGQEIPDAIMGAGEGMLLADGKEIIEVKYPLIKNEKTWKKNILKILFSHTTDL